MLLGIAGVKEPDKFLKTQAEIQAEKLTFSQYMDQQSFIMSSQNASMQQQNLQNLTVQNNQFINQTNPPNQNAYNEAWYAKQMQDLQAAHAAAQIEHGKVAARR